MSARSTASRKGCIGRPYRREAIGRGTGGMIGRDLVSKILAAGLSAGLFLIWWPQHHATTGLTSLIVRGALWTLSFELLLLAFAPLERRIAARLRTRMPARREIPFTGAC